MSFNSLNHHAMQLALSPTQFMPLSVCRSWAVKCNVVHYSWGALMINQYEGQESQLGGLTVLSYFGEELLVDHSMHNLAMNTACIVSTTKQ